uniref:Glycosyltransferase n=1 Tax=Dianthus caryophyllus TaxID=3570 RepID=A7M6J6_DIACA|nr:glucosyltransferase [Dianthus caryophyllus]
MEKSYAKLHVAFFPFMTPGHSIPMLDLVCLFIARGIKTTVFTTPMNAPNIAKYLNIKESSDCGDNDDNSSDVANIYVTPFPSKEAGLPDGIESQDSTTSPEMTLKFFVAMELLKDPLEGFLKEVRPNCLVADNFFPYATEVASKFGIPRFVFQFTGFFAMSVMMALNRFQPENSVSSDEEEFVVASLPHEIKLTKSQLQQAYEGSDGMNSAFSRLCNGAGRALFTSYGVIFNSFYELEPDYVDYYKNTMGKRSSVWHVGPVSLCNRHTEGKSLRGRTAAISDHSCLEWLNSKQPNSVIYVCFGSLTCFTNEQLKEIATALQRSEQNFIWVLKGEKNKEEWLSHGFEETVQGRGLIIWGWAPQVLILDHEAIGGFVTHCGWNSTLESISAGVPMVTWPIYAEQFYNEKLVTDVLKVGVKVGSIHWSETTGGTFLSHEKIEEALKKIMVGENAVEMRERAKKLKDLAYKAVEKEGSSYCQLSSLINELGSVTTDKGRKYYK